MKIDIHIEADQKEIASLLPETKDWRTDCEDIAKAVGEKMLAAIREPSYRTRAEQ